jgi:GT2 family glycosyltransferase
MITAILNGYRRPENLNLQISALEQQTVPPAEIMVWHNHPGGDIAMNHTVSTCTKSAYNNFNYGVWARFAFALNARTEYICLFDDDTIPGRRWFENCMDQMRKREALFGTAGVLYVDPPPPLSPEVSYYNKMFKLGWYASGNLDSAADVDFVGHAWFFKREWLSAFWRELPDPKYNLCGEDMHFSFMLQKYLGIPTVVPPHPSDQPDLWGSVRGHELGNDSASLWVSNAQDQSGQPFKASMNQYFIEQRRKGWRLVRDQ